VIHGVVEHLGIALPERNTTVSESRVVTAETCRSDERKKN